MSFSDPEDKIVLADHNLPPIDYNITGAEPWSWDPESGPRHCGPLKQLGRSMPEYALVPDDVALKFRRGYCTPRILPAEPTDVLLFKIIFAAIFKPFL